MTACPTQTQGGHQPLLMVRSWALRHGEDYQLQQVLFEPYPAEFMGQLGTEACTGRDLWQGVR